MGSKKILFVDPMSRNNLGIYDKNLLSNLMGEKYFFASKGFQFNEISNTKIIHNYNYYKKRGMLKIFSYMHSQMKLFLWVLIHKPEIVHIQWVKAPVLDMIVLFFMRFLSRKIKIVYTVHNLLPHDSFGKKIFYIYYVLYRLFDGIIVHADRTKKELVNLFCIEEIIIKEIPHGVLKYEMNEINHRMYPNKIVFSMTGILNYYKGVDILIDAWTSNKALIENDNIHLIIAGTGNILIEKIPEKCNITIINRFLTDREYQNIINSTDVGILPYRQISQSGVLLSLLAEHKPVIVSDYGGLTQPFKIGRVGWVLNDLSAQTLSELIVDIIRKREELTNIKNDKNLWGKIDNYYSWENIGKMTLDFYDSLFSGYSCKTSVLQEYPAYKI